MDKAITLNKVCFSVVGSSGRIDILDNVDVQVDSGQMFAIHGRSGSGKSSLLSIIAGLQQANSGTVEVLGQPFHKMSDVQRTSARRGRIGFVYQDFQLLPSLNAWENAILPLRLLGRSIDNAAVREIFSEFGLADRQKHFPAQLSGGEQQRVAIMRALLLQPEIILADEPTGNLDQKTARGFIDILGRSARDHAAAVVVVTHDQSIISTSDAGLELR